MNIIMAVDKEWNIGIDDKLLTALPTDLKRFKNITQGQIIVMGRNTYDSLPTKPLPKRLNVVITTHPEDLPDEVFSYTTVESFLEDIDKFLLSNFVIGWMPQIYVIGGGSLIRQLLPHCKQAYITKIDYVFEEANRSMPNLDKLEWFTTMKSDIFQENGYEYQYLLYI